MLIFQNFHVARPLLKVAVCACESSVRGLGIKFVLCCSPPTSLEEMQKQQKMIEELNKKKKAMLQETIQQRCDYVS